MNYVFGRIRLDDLNCHARKYSTWGAYPQSKLAIMLFIHTEPGEWGRVTVL